MDSKDCMIIALIGILTGALAANIVSNVKNSIIIEEQEHEIKHLKLFNEYLKRNNEALH